MKSGLVVASAALISLLGGLFALPAAAAPNTTTENVVVDAGTSLHGRTPRPSVRPPSTPRSSFPMCPPAGGTLTSALRTASCSRSDHEPAVTLSPRHVPTGPECGPECRELLLRCDYNGISTTTRRHLPHLFLIARANTPFPKSPTFSTETGSQWLQRSGRPGLPEPCPVDNGGDEQRRFDRHLGTPVFTATVSLSIGPLSAASAAPWRHLQLDRRRSAAESPHVHILANAQGRHLVPRHRAFTDTDGNFSASSGSNSPVLPGHSSTAVDHDGVGLQLGVDRDRPDTGPHLPPPERSKRHTRSGHRVDRRLVRLVDATWDPAAGSPRT